MVTRKTIWRALLREETLALRRTYMYRILARLRFLLACRPPETCYSNKWRTLVELARIRPHPPLDPSSLWLLAWLPAHTSERPHSPPAGSAGQTVDAPQPCTRAGAGGSVRADDWRHSAAVRTA